MGADCCGGAVSVSPSTEQMAEANSKQPVPAPSPPQPRKPDAEVVAEKQPYYSKRIELFEQFRQRELDRLQAAQAANEPLTGETKTRSSMCMHGRCMQSFCLC